MGKKELKIRHFRIEVCKEIKVRLQPTARIKFQRQGMKG